MRMDRGVGEDGSDFGKADEGKRHITSFIGTSAAIPRNVISKVTRATISWENIYFKLDGTERKEKFAGKFART